MMNPAGTLFEERDEPMVEQRYGTRHNGRPLVAQTKPRPRDWDKPVTILNKDWKPAKFLGWGDNDGDD
jgi:hypothetical protein